MKRKPAKKTPGRKPKGGRAYSIKLTDAVAEHYRKIGDGSLTLGIERAAMSPLIEPAARHQRDHH